MFCPYCGAKLPEGAQFCSVCGHPLATDFRASSAGQMPPSQGASGQGSYAAPPEPQTGLSTNVSYGTPVNPNDTGSFGWAVLGFFVPLVGLILYLVWKDEKPLSAKIAGKGALVSVIVSVVITILAYCVVGCSIVTLAGVAGSY